MILQLKKIIMDCQTSSDVMFVVVSWWLASLCDVDVIVIIDCHCIDDLIVVVKAAHLK